MATRTIANGGGNWSSTGTWVEGAVPTSSDAVVATSTSGQLTLDTTGNCSTINFTNYTNTFTYSGQSLNVSGATCTFVAAMTVTGNGSSQITVSGAAATCAGGGKSFPGTVSLTGSGTATVSGTNTFVNFTRTGTASKIDQLIFSGNQTVTGTLTYAGNTSQGVNRLWVQSSSIGTQRTITCTGAAIVISGDTSFTDMTHSGSPSWTNAGSSFVEDAGNNGAVITSNKTSALTLYYVGHTGSWSGAVWATSSGGAATARVPLAQDSVVFDANSFSAAAQTVTLDMPRTGGFDMSAATNSPTLTVSVTTQQLAYVFGSVVLASSMSITVSTQTLDFYARSNVSLTTNGTSVGCRVIAQCFGNTLTLADNFTCTATSTAFSLQRGNLTANGNVTVNNFTCTVQANCILNMGSGTWTLTGTGTVWNVVTPNFTLNGQTSTIVVSDSSATAKTFAGSGVTTYNNLSVTAGGSGTVTFSGASTYHGFTINAPKTVTFTQGVTTTFSAFVATGSAGNIITINSSSAGNQATLSSIGGVISCDYLSLTDSKANEVNTWYAGAHSTSVSNNTNWIFTAPPVIVASGRMTLTGAGF